MRNVANPYECIECRKQCPGDTWESGQVCLFGTLFACSVACAETWARREAAEGSKPGQPGFFMQVEPASTAS
jgi:hypothetical protein